ncbi:hypothetical protein [Enterococcus sp. S22(2020)]|uniref:hypothetical protein n=1 Tax=Enterococcus sp. S22(2020) TaxID=2759151 RepID=UPI001CE11ED1|nr:hypothetical protein [Enterococcus sp. S22(2020)]
MTISLSDLLLKVNKTNRNDIKRVNVDQATPSPIPKETIDKLERLEKMDEWPA